MNQLEPVRSEGVHSGGLHPSVEQHMPISEQLEFVSLYKSYSDPQPPKSQFPSARIDSSPSIFKQWIRHIYKDRKKIPELFLETYDLEVRLPVNDMIDCIKNLLSETCHTHRLLIEQEIEVIISECKNYYCVDSDKKPYGYTSISSDCSNISENKPFLSHFQQYCSWVIYQHYCSISQSNRQVSRLVRIISEGNSMAYFKSSDDLFMSSEFALELFSKHQSFSQISDEIEVLSEGELNTFVIAYLSTLIIPCLSTNFIEIQYHKHFSTSLNHNHNHNQAQLTLLTELIGHPLASSTEQGFLGEPANDFINLLNELDLKEARECLGRLETTIYTIIYSSKQSMKRFEGNLEQFGQAIKTIKNRLYKLEMEQYAMALQWVEKSRREATKSYHSNDGNKNKPNQTPNSPVSNTMQSRCHVQKNALPLKQECHFEYEFSKHENSQSNSEAILVKLKKKQEVHNTQQPRNNGKLKHTTNETVRKGATADIGTKISLSLNDEIIEYFEDKVRQQKHPNDSSKQQALKSKYLQMQTQLQILDSLGAKSQYRSENSQNLPGEYTKFSLNRRISDSDSDPQILKRNPQTNLKMSNLALGKLQKQPVNPFNTDITASKTVNPTNSKPKKKNKKKKSSRGTSQIFKLLESQINSVKMKFEENTQKSNLHYNSDATDLYSQSTEMSCCEKGQQYYDFLIANQSLGLTTTKDYSRNFNDYLTNSLVRQDQDDLSDEDLKHKDENSSNIHQSGQGQKSNGEKKKKKKKKKKKTEGVNGKQQYQSCHNSGQGQFGNQNHQKTYTNHINRNQSKYSNYAINTESLETEISPAATATIKMLRNLQINKDLRISCYQFERSRMQAWVQMATDNLRALSHENCKRKRINKFQSRNTPSIHV